MLVNAVRLLFLVLYASILSGGVITGIVIIVKSVTASKNGNSTKLKYNLISILCVMTAIASWVLNPGWLRVVMTIFTIPVIHAIAFMIINSIAASYVDKSVKLKRYIILSYITYLLGYILLPDGGDIGPMYVFFGIIHNNVVAGIAYSLSSIAFLGNIVVLILQIAERKKIKKQS